MRLLPVKFSTPAEELQVLTRHANTYSTLVRPEGNSPLAKLARRLNLFDVGTAYPLVFVIADSDATDEEKNRLYDLVASYVFRRAICGLTAKNYNKNFIRLAGVLARRGVSEAVFAVELASMTGDALRFPTDADLVAGVLERQLYKQMSQARLCFLLEEVELASRGKHEAGLGLVSGLTIEHVLPDTWTTRWPLEDGRVVPADRLTGVDEDMRRNIVRRDALKNTLGNLTLLTPAGNHGNDPFAQKKERLIASGLTMNIKLAALDCWNESKILERGEALAAIGCKIWPAPAMPVEPAAQPESAFAAA